MKMYVKKSLKPSLLPIRMHSEIVGLFPEVRMTQPIMLTSLVINKKLRDYRKNWNFQDKITKDGRQWLGNQWYVQTLRLFMFSFRQKFHNGCLKKE